MKLKKIIIKSQGRKAKKIKIKQSTIPLNNAS
jgi:hypothetical protein